MSINFLVNENTSLADEVGYSILCMHICVYGDAWQRNV